MDIFYRLRNKIYINITNACPCACMFCIRNTSSGVGDGSNLWLEREPTFDEIENAFKECIARPDYVQMDEIVFCGFGEPMERADTVISLTRHMKEKTSLPVRINTNGLVMLINPNFDISTLRVVDSVSVSLNADNAEEYMRLVSPKFGAVSYDAMLDFARAAMTYTKVYFSVVDALSPERIQNCRRIANSMGIPLRVRQQ